MTETVAPPLVQRRYQNRELSWLSFNARVLALAEDPSAPLLERCKFAAIFSQNLDEFFQIRVSGLREQVMAGLPTSAPEGLSPRDQLTAIRVDVARQATILTRLVEEELIPALEKESIRFVTWEQTAPEDRQWLEATYFERIFPVLTPLAVDPSHPFPYISNLSMNLAVAVTDPTTGERRFARVKVPPLLPRFVALEDGERFIPLEGLIAAQLRTLFPGMDVSAHSAFRVTRDADVDIEEDEAEDLLDAVQSVLRRRKRETHTVRLEIDPGMPTEVRSLLMRELKIGPDDVYEVETFLDLGGLWALYGLERPELKFEPWPPVTQGDLATAEPPGGLFRVLRERDVLLHHPYDAFTTSVEALVDQAADDPKVLGIKQTLYRTSGSESGMIAALARAAEKGKQVVVLVELTARFDEAANIDWAMRLEQAGVHVVYGVGGLKTHAKALLIVRNERDGVRRYVHVATGNYNEKTARLYEDVGLFTSDNAIGRDVTDLFNYLTGYSRQTDFRRVLVAPTSLRTKLVGLIQGQARSGGRITMKMNSLVDPDMIDELYAAAAAGAEVDLVIRGICCLRAGVVGLSERIRVRSIVGRYLEHSRIFRFGSGPNASYYISSADLMQRNLDRRVELATPIEDPALKAQVDQILDMNLADDVRAWELRADDEWHKLDGSAGIEAQRELWRLSVERAT